MVLLRDGKALSGRDGRRDQPAREPGEDDRGV